MSASKNTERREERRRPLFQKKSHRKFQKAVIFVTNLKTYLNLCKVSVPVICLCLHRCFVQQQTPIKMSGLKAKRRQSQDDQKTTQRARARREATCSQDKSVGHHKTNTTTKRLEKGQDKADKGKTIQGTKTRDKTRQTRPDQTRDRATCA